MTKTDIFATCLISVVFLFSSCNKDRTYIVDEKDGVRYVHNLKPQYDQPIADLEFVQQIGELEPEDENYLFSMPKA